MPEAYTHIRIARAALAQSGEHAPSTAAYEMGANGPDPLFAYRVLSAKRPWPLPELGGRMHDEQCGRFLRPPRPPSAAMRWAFWRITRRIP